MTAAIAETMRSARERHLERDLAGANAAIEGYCEALHALRTVLIGNRYARRDTCSVNAVMRFVGRAHEHAAAREFQAKENHERSHT